MVSDVLNCPQCSIKFDNNNHLPKFVPCGHTFCISCLTQLIKDKDITVCPFDTKIIMRTASTTDNFPTNLFVLQQLEEQAKSERFSFCPIHHKKQKIVCMMDKELICKNCAEYGDHEWHTVKKVNEFKEEIDKKRDELKLKLSEFDEKRHEELETLLTLDKEYLTKLIGSKFRHLKDLVTKEENVVMEEIDNFYEKQSSNVLENSSKFSSLKEPALENLKKLSNPNIDKELLEAFSNCKTLYNIQNKEDLEKIKKDSEGFCGKIKTRFRELNKEFYPSLEYFDLGKDFQHSLLSIN